MIGWLLCGLVFVVLFVALWTVFQGRSLIEKARLVQRLRSYQRRLAAIPVDGGRAGRLDMKAIGRRRLEEVCALPATSDAEVFRDNRLEAVLAVVFHQPRELHHTVHELRLYSGLFAVLFFVGLLAQAEELDANGIGHLPDVVVSFHVVPLLEVVMIAFSCIRLFNVLASIQRTLPSEHL